MQTQEELRALRGAASRKTLILIGRETVPKKEMRKEIMTVRDLAQYLRCHQSTLYLC